MLEKSQNISKNSNKTSLIMRADHKPGALYHALGIFAKSDINLSKLESRPIIGKAWHYLFYLDFDAGLNETRTQKALRELERDGYHITLLGSYPAGKVE